MSKEILKINKGDLDQLILRNEAIISHNNKIVRMRQQQLMNALKESTTLRIDIITKVKAWITLLEKRVFNPATLDQMDMNKIISLFRFIGTFTLKLLAQMNDIENVLKSYTETCNNLSVLGNPNTTTNLTSEEVQTAKKEIMKAFVDSVKETVQDAELVEQKKMKEIVPKNNMEEKKLEELDTKLEKDFPDIDKLLS